MNRFFSRLLIGLACLVAGLPHAVLAQDLLEPEKAFRMAVRALDERTLEVSFVIADGYYMYRERFKFEIDNAGLQLGAKPASMKLGAPVFPAGQRKKDEFFGDVETYRKQVSIRLPLERDGVSGETAIGAQTLKLAVTSQGCADIGVCYIPLLTPASVVLPATPAAGVSSMSQGPGSVDPDPRLRRSATDFDIAALFESKSALLVLASFFGFGLLLAFTPCVLPMIPILSGIIAGEGRGLDKRRALILSGAYVLGMALVYAIAGVAAAYSGSMIAAALQNAWVLSGFALVFVVLSLSMFGVYELQLPGFLRHRLHAAHGRLQGGRVASVAAMGGFSAVIVSPCVAAPLAGALLYISQTRDVAMGGAALFALALGMGVPLMVVGVSEGALLPRAGAWMNKVKAFFGVLLLGVAVWIVWPVVGPLVAPAVTRLAGGETGHATPFVRVNSLAELQEKLRAPGKPVMLDFYADWCVSCKEMEAFTFTDARVRAKFEGMLLLQADVTANTEEHKALLKRFRLFGPPGIVFFDPRGAEIEGLRVIGYQNADRFLVNLERAEKF